MLSLEIPVAYRRRYICSLRSRMLGSGTARWACPANRAGVAAIAGAELCEASVAFSESDWTLHGKAFG